MVDPCMGTTFQAKDSASRIKTPPLPLPWNHPLYSQSSGASRSDCKASSWNAPPLVATDDAAYFSQLRARLAGWLAG